MAIRKLRLADDTRTPKQHLQEKLVTIINAIIYSGYPEKDKYVLYEDSLQTIKSIYQQISQNERWQVLRHMFTKNKQLLKHHKIRMDAQDVCYLGTRQVLVEPNLPLKEYLESA
jgi:hypothetical protein